MCPTAIVGLPSIYLERNLGPILAGSFTGRLLIPFPCLHPNVRQTNLGPYPQFFDIPPQWVFGDQGVQGYIANAAANRVPFPDHIAYTRICSPTPTPQAILEILV